MGAMASHITGVSIQRLFMCRSKKTSKLRVTGLCVGNSPVAGEFPAQRASNAENYSIWWRHKMLGSLTVSTVLLKFISLPNLPKHHSYRTNISVDESSRNLAQRTPVTLPYSMENFRRICRRRKYLGTWFSDRMLVDVVRVTVSVYRDSFHRVYELITEILWKIFFPNYDSHDQITILHMPRQLTCRHEQIVTWSDH